jgi:hypothetical protein
MMVDGLSATSIPVPRTGALRLDRMALVVEHGLVAPLSYETSVANSRIS